MKELKLIAQAEIVDELIKALMHASESIKENIPSVPLYSTDGKHKIKVMITETKNPTMLNEAE
jgi:hypothetical protein